MRRKFLFLTSVLVFQQIFDLFSTLYLTSLPGGMELNPILRPLWDIEHGMLWLVAIKLFMCLLLILGVPYLAKEHPYMMWAPRVICAAYWLLVCWNGYLVCATL